MSRVQRYLSLSSVIPRKNSLKTDGSGSTDGWHLKTLVPSFVVILEKFRRNSGEGRLALKTPSFVTRPKWFFVNAFKTIEDKRTKLVPLKRKI